ncbi:MAG: hypothetical protein ACYSW0_24160 [Planctomycetota bacterium]|jgi:hypothetical protein
MEYFEIMKMAIPLVAIGGAWGGVKVALNGTVKRVEKIEDTQKITLDRCARMETKIDILVERK